MNRHIIDDRMPSEGHLERFLQKYEEAVAAKRKTRVLRLTWTLASAAAVAVVAFVAIAVRSGMSDQPVDRFADLDSCMDVYQSYINYQTDAVRRLSLKTAMMNEEEVSELTLTLSQLTEERMTLFDILPAEMPEEEKLSVFKRYYNDILDGVDRVEKLIKNYRI